MPHRRLTELSIAAGALAVIDVEGIDALTIRRLAVELGVAPTAVYHHFADKDAILESVTQLLLAEVEPPAPHLGWLETTQHVMCSLRSLARRHPRAAPLISRFPPRTPDALVFVEIFLRALRTAGFDTAATARAYRALVAYFVGSLQIEFTDFFPKELTARRLPDSLDHISISRMLPNTSEMIPEVAAQDPDDEFRFGLELLLGGLTRQLER